MNATAKKQQKLSAKRIREAARSQDYDEDCLVRDMLSDLRHYCDSKGLDFAAEDRVAYGNYAAERRGL